MASVQTSLEVGAPVRRAYDQWTRLESFPDFMEGIRACEHLSDTEVRFRGDIGGVERTWTARIVEQVPDERIAWVTVEGTENRGTVLFEPIDDRRCRVTLILDYEPGTWTERLGDVLGFFESRVKQDLENFRSHVEAHAPAAGWRGEVHGGVRVR